MGLLKVDADDYKAFALRVKEADKKIARGVRKKLREAGKPLAAKVIAEAPDELPQRGGLADLLKAARPALSLAAKSLAITVRSPGHDLRSINAGRLRHPTYGHKPWVSQGVPAQAYDRAIEAHTAEAVDVMGKVLQEVMEEL